MEILSKTNENHWTAYQKQTKSVGKINENQHHRGTATCRTCMHSSLAHTPGAYPPSVPLSDKRFWRVAIYIYIYIYIGGWGGESAAAPTGKSFRFVRACERAGARARSNRFRLPRWIFLIYVSACPAVVFWKLSVFVRVVCKMLLFYTMVEKFSHKT